MSESIDSLIDEGKKVRKDIVYLPSPDGVIRLYKAYSLQHPQSYHTWVTQCIQLLNSQYSGEICVEQFKAASEQFESKSNHYSPEPIDKMLGILEACRRFSTSAIDKEIQLTDTLKLRIQKVEKLLAVYKRERDNLRYGIKTEDAFWNWYSEACALFASSPVSREKSFETFSNLVRGAETLTLDKTFNEIQVPYKCLINKLKMDNMSKKIEPDYGLQKKPLLFISHSSKDERFVEALVDLLRTLGFNKSNLFCSSVDGFGIDEGLDIFETLREKFQNFEIYVVFVLSKSYYDSVACMNEMGAAWVLKSDYSTMITPNFSVKEIQGAINPNKLAIVINDKHVRSTLNKFKERLLTKFHLNDEDDDIVWENSRNVFLEKVGAL